MEVPDQQAQRDLQVQEQDQQDLPAIPAHKDLRALTEQTVQTEQQAPKDLQE